MNGGVPLNHGDTEGTELRNGHLFSVSSGSLWFKR